jgi:hypothetical protein
VGWGGVGWGSVGLRNGETAEFKATRVPRQCSLVLLVKVFWKGGKKFGSEQSSDEKWGKEKLVSVPLRSNKAPNSDTKSSGGQRMVKF